MCNLDDLAKALEGKSRPVTVFFRDDDAGWANGQLAMLCERMSEVGIDLDLAVIPAALDRTTSAAIIRLSRQFGSTLNFHQHGYAHVNHQQEGRRCEFGDERRLELQRHDIALGRERLHDTLGTLVDPIFTPPWNRCTADTCRALSELDFKALSRIAGSSEIDHFGLADISVSIDWRKKKQNAFLTWTEFCQYAIHHLLNFDVVGVMLHHEHLENDDLHRLHRFIDCLRDSGKVRFQSMLQIVELECVEKGGSYNVPS